MDEHEAMVAQLRDLEREIRREMLLRDPDPLEYSEITLPQLRLLYQVEAGGAVSAQHLADQLDVTAPTITNTVDRLVRRNLLSRVEDPQDRRRKRITITPAGYEVLETFHQHGLWYLLEAASHLTSDELRTLLHILKRLAQIDAELQAHR
ncbi:MAG: MarR family transcriptional regulator [Actinomycetaceae bacterium]|nr:MarR family transcriptional regulator [Actinomycetaceae bacterium]